NTSIYAMPVMTTTRGSDGVDSKSLSSIIGFSMDIFLFNELTFLTLQASLYGLEGNTYVLTGAGIGVEF
ncbi:MAG: hypothetical protein KDD29_09425, partial [Flavobacteriales bacterium]|nr:hypothetical protein [Flavobacteriales bacterium]